MKLLSSGLVVISLTGFVSCAGSIDEPIAPIDCQTDVPDKQLRLESGDTFARYLYGPYEVFDLELRDDVRCGIYTFVGDGLAAGDLAAVAVLRDGQETSWLEYDWTQTIGDRDDGRLFTFDFPEGIRFSVMSADSAARNLSDLPMHIFDRRHAIIVERGLP